MQEFPEKVRRLSRSLDSQMANKFTESSEELPNHLQWTMSKDIFQKVLSGASWLSKSTTIQNGKQTETQQLLNAKNRNFSYNEIFPGKSFSSLQISVGILHYIITSLVFGGTYLILN